MTPETQSIRQTTAPASASNGGSSPVLHVFRDPPLNGPENMARDEHLLCNGTLAPAVLRLYAWEPATISLGCFQRFAQVAGLPAELRNLPIVRRRTGGGAILHDREVTYCLVVRDPLPIARKAPAALYELAHACWRDALSADAIHAELAPDSFPLPTPRTGPFFCFERPGRTDLVLGNDKLLGSAQRRVQGAVLQHGSLLLARRFAAHPGADLHEPRPETVERWIRAFTRELAARLSLLPVESTWHAEQIADIRMRQERFASEAWTQKH